MNDNKLSAFWQQYLDTQPDKNIPMPEAWYFCDNEADANELGALVVAGIKTATASLFDLYEAEGEALPQVGGLSIIINWAGDPLCVIETTDIQIKPFNMVDPQHAYDEGEGDRSLAYWREVHWRFFSKECILREFSEDMLVVCERFKVLF